jgi:acyl carrier protein
MSDTRERLSRCFSVVFPKLSSQDVLAASPTSVAEWDSLAMVTLLTVIQEEFRIRLPFDNIDHFQSFESICRHLEAQVEKSTSG